MRTARRVFFARKSTAKVLRKKTAISSRDAISGLVLSVQRGDRVPRPNRIWQIECGCAMTGKKIDCDQLDRCYFWFSTKCLEGDRVQRSDKGFGKSSVDVQ